MKKLLLIPFLILTIFVNAQVKIGNNPATINSNSVLELESTNKGFLPPRIVLNSISAVTPLTGIVPAGMLVFSSGGIITDGYYYWDGSEWKKLDNGNKNLVTKTANATLLKSESYVVARNDITITLPVVTAADNGLSISVKNIGAHTDLVIVSGNGAATIDGAANVNLTKNVALTFIASGGSWIINNAKKPNLHLMEVDAQSSWVTITEAIEFLNVHMVGPTVIKLADENYQIPNTITINLPFALTIQGLSYGSATISAASGLAGKAMFRCLSASYFKMLIFNAAALVGYGTAVGEDAIRFLGSGTYNEVKDCSFDRFYNTILDSTNAELWIFETDISNAQRNGILVHGAVAGVTIKVAETDFIACARGINLSKGSAATLQFASGGYYNTTATDTAILYQPATFTGFTSISITGNLWNNIGKYIEGFDFTRSDGRDANTIMISNAGMADQKPNCFINVLNSLTTKTLTTQNTWYVTDWGTNTLTETCKWTVANNKITFQPVNRKNGVFTVSGNLSVNQINQNISIGIVKNGNSAIRYGETTLRITTADQPFQFSFIASLKDIAAGDYFEVYYSNATSGGKAVMIQDIQWLVNTQ